MAGIMIADRFLGGVSDYSNIGGSGYLTIKRCTDGATFRYWVSDKENYDLPEGFVGLGEFCPAASGDMIVSSRTSPNGGGRSLAGLM